MDDVTWGALTLTLTLLGGLYTWWAFRNRGVVPAVRGVGLTLIPVALLLTDTLRMVTRIGSAIGSWALHLAWDPFTWMGIVLAGVSVVCFVTAGYLSDRRTGTSAAEKPGRDAAKELRPSRGRKAEPVVAPVDDEMAEIEAMLRKRGIT